MAKHKHKTSVETIAKPKQGLSEFANDIHFLIHALRMTSNYKPSIAELKISKLVSNLYADSCKECAEAKKRFDTMPAKPQKQSFLNKIGEALEE